MVGGSAEALRPVNGAGQLPAEVIDLAARPVQFQGASWATWLLGTMGWTMEFDGLPSRQGVMVFYPHTSNWDFVLTMLAKAAAGFPVRFWSKDSLLRAPLLGRFMLRVGAIPVDRSSANGAVDDAVQACKAAKANNDLWWLALSPEGTRSKGEGWRSGFYHVAHRCQVPVALMTIDHPTRRMACKGFILLTGREDEDMQRIAAVMAGVRGRKPDAASPIRLITSRRTKR
jgi:1-acyl-sn-glycerol-3-phosphate acyltransferase